MTLGPMVRALQRIVDVKEDEAPALLWSWGYFFCLLASYFILRPLREEMGVAGGTRNLPWLFLGTMIAIFFVHPPFAALVAKLSRTRFISIAYRFFLINLLAFFALFELLPPEQTVWVARVFFIWTSVFNLFVVSVFWGFMVDVFTAPQGRRLYGFIGLGGTLGGIAGAFLTAALAPRLGPVNLLLVSAALLEAAVFCVRRLASAAEPIGVAKDPAAVLVAAEKEKPIGGSFLAGITHVARSPYLLGICAYMLLFTFGSTVLYFHQAEIAKAAYADSGARTAFFAKLDLVVQVLTLGTQAFLTGRILQVLGVALTLTILPAISAIGFAALGAAHSLAVFSVFQVLRRAGEYALARPAREVLYTVLPREDKYKAKHFIDTFVYRMGDQVGAWSFAGLGALGLAVSGISFVAVPISIAWLLIGLYLGRKHEGMAVPERQAALEGEPVGAGLEHAKVTARPS